VAVSDDFNRVEQARRAPGAIRSVRRPDRDRRTRVRIAGLSACLAAVAGAAWATVVRPLSAPPAPFRVPLWALAVGFALAELATMHVEFRRDAHSVSLNELPLVLGLVFASPGELIAAELIGAGLALALHRRQAPLKLLFNLSHFAVEVCAALVVFHAVPHHVRTGPGLWLAVMAAAVTAATVSVVTVSAVIWVNQSRVVLRQLGAVLGVVFASTLLTTCLALGAVSVLWTDRAGAVLLVVIGLLLGLAYRGYASLRQRHASLELLHEFTQAIRTSGDAEEIIGDVLRQARRMLRAETAELALLPAGDGEPTQWLVLDGDTDAPATVLEPSLHPSLQAIVAGGRPLVAAKSCREPLARAYLAERGHRDCMVAPLLAGAEPLGVLVVANRLGDVTTFDDEDGRFFETVAAHTNVTLQNARLVDRLRHDALHDSLTGLANRVLFQQRVADAIGRRRPDDAAVAVMLIDLDGFKEINDTLGHAAGDVLLQEVADRLRGAIAGPVTVARLGGDEFGVLDAAHSDRRSAATTARAVRDALRPPFR